MPTFSTFYGCLLGASCALLYISPWLDARRRGIASRRALFWVNLLLGWTVVGWFACVLWSRWAQSAETAYFDKARRAAKQA
jgi:hypothetical protein